MIDLSQDEPQIQCVTNFQDLVSTPFHGAINAICCSKGKNESVIAHLLSIKYGKEIRHYEIARKRTLGFGCEAVCKVLTTRFS